LPPSELPILTARSTPYRLPRHPGAGRRVAATLPFSDTTAFASAIRGADRASTAQPHLARVACTADQLVDLTAQVAHTGVAGLRVVVEVGAVPQVDPQTVRKLAVAGVAALEIAGTVTVDLPALPHWIELNKAALRYGLPLAWSGRLPAQVDDQLLHLVPARDQPEWLRRWRYGMFGWRRGPGFALVADARGDLRQLTLALPALTEMFGPHLDRPAPASDVDVSTLTELAAARLAMVVEDRAVWLPYRTRRWPVSSLL
jgi:hypothetical protein